MTRFKFLFAAVVAAAIVGVMPAAHAQTACLGSVNSGSCNVHFVGAGSSAQFNPAAIGADALAATKLGAYATASSCVYHWSAKNAGNLVDNRGTVAIPLEPANMWIVWIAALDGSGTGTMNTYSVTSNVATIVGTGFTYNVGDAIVVSDTNGVFTAASYTVTANNSSGTSVSFAFTSANVGSTSDSGSITDNTVYACPFSGGTKISTGNNSITDIWMDASVDSTVGVRSFLAQINSTTSGVAVETIPTTAGNVLGTGAHNLWPDNASDVSILTGGATNLPVAVGTDQAGIKDVHVNAGLTDIRPEDALFATTRSIGVLSATRTGLGYNSTTNVGASILTSEGTGTKATPVKFAITGNDPITKVAIRGYQTFPIGAAPIVFILNHGSATAGNYPTNLNTGILGTGVANGTGWPTTDATTGKYLAANLFDGSGACAMNNPALTGGGTAALTLFLREPLSGTMNTTEYNLFRTTGNVSDSQEQNVVPAGTFNMNPLSAQPCGCGSNSPDAPTCSGPGTRSRAIGTGEVVGTSSTGVLGTTNSLGCDFHRIFANWRSLVGGGASRPLHRRWHRSFRLRSFATTCQSRTRQLRWTLRGERLLDWWLFLSQPAQRHLQAVVALSLGCSRAGCRISTVHEQRIPTRRQTLTTPTQWRTSFRSPLPATPMVLMCTVRTSRSRRSLAAIPERSRNKSATVRRQQPMPWMAVTPSAADLKRAAMKAGWSSVGTTAP